MTTSSLFRQRQSITVMAIAVSLAVIMATPAAAAAGTGEAAGEGRETDIQYGTDYGNPPFSFCQEVLSSTYVVDFVGEFSAGEAVYAGPATVKYTTTEKYYIGPEGTYTGLTPQNECDPATLGDPITTTVTASGNGDTGYIDCGTVPDGEYFRLSSDVTLTWSAECTVHNSVLNVTDDTSADHVLTGELIACLRSDDPNDPGVPPGCTESVLAPAAWAYVGT